MTFDLEIQVRVPSGHADANKSTSYTFGRGKDDYTMGNVFAQAKEMCPAPDGTRPRLSVCGFVLDNKSEEMYMNIRAFLRWKCADYMEDTAALQLDATLIFDVVLDQADSLITAYDRVMAWRNPANAP